MTALSTYDWPDADRSTRWKLSVQEYPYRNNCYLRAWLVEAGWWAPAWLRAWQVRRGRVHDGTNVIGEFQMARACRWSPPESWAGRCSAEGGGGCSRAGSVGVRRLPSTAYSIQLPGN